MIECDISFISRIFLSFNREFEEGKNGETVAPSSPSAGVASEETKQAEVVPVPTMSVSTSAKASITAPIARFAMNKPSTEPPPFEFTVEHPSGLNALDVDIIKLTAQYTVANGKDFLLGLAVREQRNPQFDFLKPTHMLFSYFTTLVDAYAKVLQPSSEQTERMKAKKDRMKALESAVHRWEWRRSEEERKKKDAVHVDQERSAFQSIDWFDFTVVETIDFGEDELYEQPKPLGRVEEDEDMEMDEDDDDHLRQAATQRMEMPQPPPFNPNARVQSSSSSSHVAQTEDVNMVREGGESSIYGGGGELETEMEVEIETEMDLNVVSDYTPRMAGSGPNTGPMTMVDPISGKIIPVDEMSEHMRVQLMDPRWRIEQKRFQEKQRETGYAEGASIADSLQQFARKRGDIFGQNQPQQEDERKNTESTVQWDGHMASIPQMQQLKNEIAARAPQLVVTAASVLPAIGPTIPGLGPQAPRIVVPMSVPAPPSTPMPLPAPIVTLNYPIASIPLPQMGINIPLSVPLATPPPPAVRPSAPYPVPPEDLEGPVGKKPRTDAPLTGTPSTPEFNTPKTILSIICLHNCNCCNFCLICDQANKHH